MRRREHHTDFTGSRLALARQHLEYEIRFGHLAGDSPAEALEGGVLDFYRSAHACDLGRRLDHAQAPEQIAGIAKVEATQFAAQHVELSWADAGGGTDVESHRARADTSALQDLANRARPIGRGHHRPDVAKVSLLRVCL